MTFIERTNTMAQFNIGAAFDIGLKVPDLQYLNQVEGDLDLEEWIIIPSTQIALKIVDGVHITTTGWWTGEKLTNAVVSIHDRSLLFGGQGGQLEDNCITMFQEKPSPVLKHMQRLCKILKQKQPKYTGIISIEAVVQDETVYYYDIRFGVSYDLALCYTKFFNTSFETVGEDLKDMRHKASRYCMTLRVWAYPYNEDRNLSLPEEIFNPKHVQVGPVSYIAFNWHSKIQKGWYQLTKILKGTEYSGACYRMDGDVKARQVYFAMKNKGLV